MNISGYAALKEACSKCFASLFTDRAICYRIDNGFDHFKVALSIGIMKMVRSDLAIWVFGQINGAIFIFLFRE